jgi:16S rRNA (adenine1518-N6/adenine1519-N6)-dimethyltransferase
MNIKPKKSLGQHFLHDANVLRNISAAVAAKDDERVIEIGPGEGALTVYLMNQYKDLLAIEIDDRAVELLAQKFPDLNVIHKDILKTDWDDILKSDGKNVVVGNIPYYITSPILFKVMDAGAVFRRAVFLMQKEVAERLVASPGSKAYGILSVQAQLFGKVEYLFTVSRHVFHPKPKVESAVIAFEPFSEELAVPREQLKQVVRTAFNQRRKKLSNSLKALQIDPEKIDFDLNLRPDQIKPTDYLKLTEEVFKLK